MIKAFGEQRTENLLLGSMFLWEFKEPSNKIINVDCPLGMTKWNLNIRDQKDQVNLAIAMIPL